MKGNIGIHWLMILCLISLYTDYTLAQDGIDCANYLKEDKIDDALACYLLRSDGTSIKEIIESAYENEDSFNKLLNFIGKTGSSESFLYGYTALFDKMKSNDHMKALNVLLLTSAVDKNKDSKLSKLLSSLEESLLVMHQNRDYDGLYNYSDEKTGDDDSYQFGNEVMPTFVRTAYNNDPSNVIKILDLRSGFKYMPHKLYLINALITEMKNRDQTNEPEFFIVMSDVVSVRSDVRKEDNAGKDLIVQVYENIPEHLRPLMYKNLCIQNVETKEYMVAGDLADFRRRNIVTKIKSDNLEAVTFQAKFLDRGRTIIFKNIDYDQHLYFVNNGPPRDVCGWTQGSLENDEQAHFTIEVVDNKNVRMRSKKFNEYVYSPSDNSGNYRQVYSSSDSKENNLWKFTVCHLSI